MNLQVMKFMGFLQEYKNVYNEYIELNKKLKENYGDDKEKSVNWIYLNTKLVKSTWPIYK